MYDVIYDPEKETAALIDSDNGRALGPLLAGPKDVTTKLFDSFAGALGADVTTIHPADLDHHFRGFIEALAEEEEAGPTPPAGSPADGTTAASTASTAGGASGAPASSSPSAETALPGETGKVAGATEPGEEAAVGAEGVSGAAATPTGDEAAGTPADGGLPTGVEHARAGEEGTPGEAAIPAGTAGAGVPKAPGA